MAEKAEQQIKSNSSNSHDLSCQTPKMSGKVAPHRLLIDSASAPVGSMKLKRKRYNERERFLDKSANCQVGPLPGWPIPVDKSAHRKCQSTTRRYCLL